MNSSFLYDILSSSYLLLLILPRYIHYFPAHWCADFAGALSHVDSDYTLGSRNTVWFEEVAGTADIWDHAGSSSDCNCSLDSHCDFCENFSYDVLLIIVWIAISFSSYFCIEALDFNYVNYEFDLQLRQKY